MVSSVLAQAILNQRAPDIVGAFREGQEISRQEQVRTLSGEALKAGGGEALTELQGLDPEIAFSIGESIRAQTAQDTNDFIRDAGIGKRMLEQGNIQGFIAFTDQRSNILRQLGRDTSQTDRFRDLAASGQAEQALQELQAFSGALDSAKSISAGQQEFESLIKDLPEEEKKKAKRIKLGLTPRATGSAAQTIADLGTGEQVADSQAIIKQREKFGELTGASRAKSIDSGFERIVKINTGINNIDRATEAIRAGAGTGAIERFLPSIIAASVELDQIRNELALDVIGGVTLGAISEAELDLVKQVALPEGLDSPQLLQHLEDRKAAQIKLRDYFQEQIDFLDQGGTVAGFLRAKEKQRKEAGLAAVAPFNVPLPPEGITAQETVEAPGGEVQRNIKVTF